MSSKLILPESNGVLNIEIRRMKKALEAERQQQRGVHPRTADQIATELDKLRAMAQEGQFRAMVVVGLLRPSREQPETPSDSLTVALAPMVKTLFACPQTDRPMALDLARMTDAFLQHVMTHNFPPETTQPPDRSA